MKRAFLMGTLVLGLTACGGGGGTPTPDTSYPYNPAASVTTSTDARTPYRGDWVFTATLADGTKRYGVASVTTKYSGNDVKNGGGGLAAWCYTSNCAKDDEQGAVLIGSVNASGGAALAVAMVPKNAQKTRFVMADDNGRVEQVQNYPTISGQGVWTSAAGVDQAAVFAFAQVNTQSKLGTQQARAQALRAAQGLVEGQGLHAQGVAPLGEVRAALESALAK